MGEKGPKGAPVSLKTFRLTSNDKGVLEAAAKLYGGRVQAWDDAPDAGMWQLTTGAAELDILIPRALRSLSQKWELWQGGTCERRCDGRTEEITGSPCLCGDQRGEDGFCEIMTRLSIILPRLPGLGLWRLDTGGWHAASTIGPTIELLLALDSRSMVPAVLRAVPGSSKVRGADGKVTTHRFIRPMIDAPGITIGQLVAGAESDLPQIEAGEPARPKTAEERVAAQRAAVEERRAAAEAAVRSVDADGVIEGEATDAGPALFEGETHIPTPQEVLDAADAKGIDPKSLAARLFPEWAAADPKRPLSEAERVGLMAEISKS